MHIIATYENRDPLEADKAESLRRLVDRAIEDTEWETAGLDLHAETVLIALGINLDTRRSFMSWRYPFLADLIVHKGGHHVALSRNDGDRLVIFTLG